MNDAFSSVNPNLVSAAKNVQQNIVEKLAEKTNLPPAEIMAFLNKHSFEISTDFCNDLSYEISQNGFLLLALFATVINRVMESHEENDVNDKSASTWLLSAIGGMKYRDDRDIINGALEIVQQELEQPEE